MQNTCSLMSVSTIGNFTLSLQNLKFNQAIGDKVICEAISYTDCMANVAIYQI